MTDQPNKKRQKLSSIEITDLPDEVLLKILGYLEVKNLILCSHVSKKLRNISQDKSFWQKTNLYNKVVPIDFLKMVLNNGCKFLNLKVIYIHWVSHNHLSMNRKYFLFLLLVLVAMVKFNNSWFP